MYTNEELTSFLKTIQPNSNIGFYFGVFDPFHEGHHHVIQVAQKHYCTHIICGSIRTSNSKPNLSSHKLRYDMMKLSLENDSNVFLINNKRQNVFLNDIIKTIKYHLPSSVIYGIIGSDTYLRFKQKLPWMQTDKYLVVPRLSFPISYNNTNPQFILMEPELFNEGKGLTLSSTYIRTLITANKTIPTNELPEKITNYIKNRMVYTLKDIIKSISDSSTITKEVSRPYSGNYVYCVMDKKNNPLHYVKIFTDPTVGQLETNMLKWMKSNNIPTIDIIKYYNYNNYITVLFTSPASGKPLGILLESPLSNERINNLGKSIGKLLKQIHDYGYEIPTNEQLNIWLQYMNPNIDTANYKANPGMICKYLHGDFSLTNIFVDDSDNLTVIDPEPTEYGGPPAYDYYRFLASVKRCKNDIVKDKLSRGFIQGYGETNFTSDAKTFFETYWQVKFVYYNI